MCRVWRGTLLVFAVLLHAVAARAVTVEHLNVTRHGKAYMVTARVRVDAPLGPTYRAATNFERLPDYSTMIESTRLIGHNELATRIRLCVVWYCKTVRQVMRYHLAPPKRIDMTVVPDRGDLAAGQAHWRFAAVRNHSTDLRFHARVVPDFWVPPLIGPWAIARALREQVASTATAIERLARQRAESSAKQTP